MTFVAGQKYGQKGLEQKRAILGYKFPSGERINWPRRDHSRRSASIALAVERSEVYFMQLCSIQF